MIWWWIGNVTLLVVVIPLVVILANRLIRDVREVRAYADDILVHGLGITGNLAPVPALAFTAELVRAARDAAARYAGAVAKLLGGGS